MKYWAVLFNKWMVLKKRNWRVVCDKVWSSFCNEPWDLVELMMRLIRSSNRRMNWIAHDNSHVLYFIFSVDIRDALLSYFPLNDGKDAAKRTRFILSQFKSELCVLSSFFLPVEFFWTCNIKANYYFNIKISCSFSSSSLAKWACVHLEMVQ